MKVAFKEFAPKYSLILTFEESKKVGKLVYGTSRRKAFRRE
jgi:hypothetical protein